MTRLEEPVERYLRHALRGERHAAAVRGTMSGRIKVGAWLPFTAEQACDGRSFLWRARVGGGLLVVTDRYADGAGSTEGRLFGRLRVFGVADSDTTRSAAGRTALEAIWCPAALLPERGVTWHTEAPDVIVASWELPPERPEIRLRIDERGGLRAAWAQRWQGRDGYVPCGCEVHAERRFGDLVVPSRVTVGWGFGTPAYRPFFTAELHELAENY